MNIFIDVETYSSADLKKSGVYPYFESPDFEILLIGYAVDDEDVVIFDPSDSYAASKFTRLAAKADRLIAHNATFERLAFKASGFDFPVWLCTMVKASFCGFPASLEEAGKALNLSIKKDLAGKALIRFFCIPCKPSKANDFRTRNLPKDAPAKWHAFKDYLRDDVETTRLLFEALEAFDFTEQTNYLIDQRINDRGVALEIDLINNAVELDKLNGASHYAELLALTKLDNPNSPSQLSRWLTDRTGNDVEDLKAATVKDMLEGAEGDVRRVLELRKMNSNTSVKKFASAKNYLCKDGRARGLFQFYGAGRTGRWAGRGIQLQNMPRNYMSTLSEARRLVIEKDFETLAFIYPDLQQVLKELTRTMLIPSPDNVLMVADFSAIEARVIAWLAREDWRLEVFETHGKIYEASASMMFSVSLESISFKDAEGKTQKGINYEMRSKGKIAELALGYQGGVGALQAMGGEAMGLSVEEMQAIVKRWRRANPAICQFWADAQSAASKALAYPGKAIKLNGLTFRFENDALLCFLPSGRPLVYQKARLARGNFGPVIKYMGVDQLTRRWVLLETYGGKLVENIVQAVARDLLAVAIANAEAAGFKIVIHVHDEIVADEPREGSEARYKELVKEMTKAPAWAFGLPLNADGFITDFYLKD